MSASNRTYILNQLLSCFGEKGKNAAPAHSERNSLSIGGTCLNVQALLACNLIRSLNQECKNETWEHKFRMMLSSLVHKQHSACTESTISRQVPPSGSAQRIVTMKTRDKTKRAKKKGHVRGGKAQESKKT